MLKVKVLAGAVLLALLAAACGGDSGTSPTSQGSPTETSSPLTNKGTKDVSSMTGFTLEIDDFYFEPTFLKVKDGQKLSLELENEGSNQHTFTITSLNIDETIDPGAKKEIDVTLSGTADVAFFCRFHGASGMRGAFFFGAAPQTPASGGATTSGETDQY